ncbi:MAG: glycosyltransferase [Chloroflexi bacterium]|nr:glycosyltransferase [Chloroflexota bacterium]
MLPLKRIAVISVHGCPMAVLGTKSAGGMNVYIRALAQGLCRLGFAVDIFTRCHDSDEPPVYSLEEHCRVIHLEAGPADAAKEDLFGYCPSFLEGVKAFAAREGLQYDLLHTHYWLSGWVGQALAQEWDIPHVVTFHTLAEIKTRALAGEGEATPRSDTERQVAAGADRVIVSTAHERSALHELYGALEDKVRVVPGGVDLELFHPGETQAARERLGLNGHQTILYVGRLDAIKGVDVLLHSLAQVETGKQVQLLVVGGNEEDGEYQRLKGLAQELGLAEVVAFLGSKEHEALPAYYQAADVCVVPSYYESFGLVALESMACGTPVVASRVPGLQTIVRDNRSGYLVPWHCPDAFADRLEVLLSNEALRRCIGQEARRTAMRMGWDGTAQGVAAVYRELGVRG